MKLPRILLSAATALALAGCTTGGFTNYTLVKPQAVNVANRAITVMPGRPYNRLPGSPFDIDLEENWTLNGPLLDSISFLGGIRDGRAIVRQRRRDDRQVPLFRANMTPPELVSMIESFYRVRAGSTEFAMTGLEPTTFLGHSGFRFDYDHLTGNEVKRRGRAYGAVIGNRFYMMLLDAARMHYFGDAVGDFDAMARGARLRSMPKVATAK